MAIRLSKKYKPLWDANYDYAIVTGGRGSSKSFSVGSFLENLSFEKKQKILFTRYTLISAHLSVIPEFVEKIDLEGHHGYFDVSKNEITNKLTGSSIIFKGLKTSSGNQTANLKSLQGVSTWVLDEAEELQDEAMFDKIDESIRTTKTKNRVILILNPATKEHFIYKRFFEAKGVREGFTGIKENILYIHTTYLDNLENLSDKFISKVEDARINRPKYYAHSIMGGWLNRADGVVYDNWTIGKFDDSLAYGFGLDFGFSIDPDALVQVAIDEKKKIIYAKECLYKNRLSTKQLSDRILEHAGNNKEVIADSAEGRLISEIKVAKVNIKPVKKPRIEISIRKVSEYKLVITEDSINLIKELNNYVWHDKKSNTPVDAYNHLLDALRYYVWTKTRTTTKYRSTLI